MPFTDRQLRYNHGAGALVAVFQYLQQEEFHRMTDGLQIKVVKDKQLGFFRYTATKGGEPIQPFENGALWASTICSQKRLRLK